MNLQIELFSTPTVEGRKILSSKGFVCANVDFDADVISKLPNYFDPEGIEPYHVALFDALEKEVISKGANAVIDLHIEYSYGSYDSRRLLISVQGTAVVLEGIEIIENKNIKSHVLEQQILRKHILMKIKQWRAKYEEDQIKVGNLSLFNVEWEFICRYPDMSFADDMHFAYNKGLLNISIDNRFGIYPYHGRYYEYFEELPYDKQIELVYKYGKDSYLVEKCDLFDAKQILAWAQKGEYEFATACLEARKKEYSKQDLEDMQELYDFFANLPQKLTEKQEYRVKEFGIKVETLKELLTCN